MPTYSVFGLSLDSEVPLPGLPQEEARGALAWRLRTSAASPVPDPGPLVGQDVVYGSVMVRAHSSEHDVRLAFDDTGAFDVVLADRTIRWYPGPDATANAVRADLLGRVLAVAALTDGGLPLHASAVALDDGAIAVLGPKHAGKSTLALALVRQGGRLVTDDMLVLRLDESGRPWAVPGVQQLRVWEDSARTLGVIATEADALTGGGPKPTLPLPSHACQVTPVPLRSCIVLRGTDDRTIAVAERSLLREVHATMALMRFSKLGPLAGGALGRRLLAQAVAVSRAIAVHEVVARRDLAQVDALAATLAMWHREAGPPGAVHS